MYRAYTHGACPRPRRRSIVLLTLVAMPVLIGSIAADAITIVNNTGIVAPAQTITFSEFAFATDTQITNQFGSLGVLFSPGMFYNTQPTFFPTDFLSSYEFPFGQENNISILFSESVDAAAVALQSNDVTTTFTALLGGSIVETFSTATTSSTLPDLAHASDFYGFEGIVFDELRIENSQEIFQIDNLQTSAVLVPVPEPSTALLVSGGIGWMGLRRRHAMR